MLGIGGFTPLDGLHDARRLAGRLRRLCARRAASFWPIPITLSADAAPPRAIGTGSEIALVDPGNGEILATMRVSEKYRIDKAHECVTVFRTTDLEHPGVKMVMEQGEVNLAGPVKVLSDGGFKAKYGALFMTPGRNARRVRATRLVAVAAFQTRNPMHRSHEYLAKVAIETCDGVLVHSLLGNLKPGDIPAEVRTRAIAVADREVFRRRSTVVQAGYPLDMRYAGPREALLHALFRQNYGCSHQIVGRDHAGVGSYYGPFDAHHIFDEIPRGSLETRRSRSTGRSGATGAAAWHRAGRARTRRGPAARVRHEAAQMAVRGGRCRPSSAARGARDPARVLRGPRRSREVEVKLSGHSAR